MGYGSTDKQLLETSENFPGRKEAEKGCECSRPQSQTKLQKLTRAAETRGDTERLEISTDLGILGVERGFPAPSRGGIRSACSCLVQIRICRDREGVEPSQGT